MHRRIGVRLDAIAHAAMIRLRVLKSDGMHGEAVCDAVRLTPALSRKRERENNLAT